MKSRHDAVVEKHGSTVITNAYSGASRDQASRQRRYAITMAFRTACFIAMIFVPGALRWVLLGGAVVLPYIAVLFANQAAPRPKSEVSDQAEPVDVSDHKPIGQFQTITIEPDDVDPVRTPDQSRR